ncbi:hypothetical protein ACHAXA_000394 [Cyclostephanos tholiformis]|uniref:Cyclin n=1 Tax=Cyclostephanos tholiformis TaxID=382380 RepID=A0ABD3R321_9STRA
MEYSPSEEAEGQVIVRVLAAVLERLVSANSQLSSTWQQEQTHFHAQRAPAIGILQYLERIHKYASCSKECFILALIYIDRLIQRNNFLLTELNVHRVVITSVLLAAKFFDDAYYNNAYYAKVGGVLVEEMNILETQFLFKIDFSLSVLPEVFEKYEAELISHSDDIGLERITRSTDEKLFGAVVAPPKTPQSQVIGDFHRHSVVALQTHNQTEFIDYSSGYSDTMQAAPTVEWQQRSTTAMAAAELLYPFPALARQVSAPRVVSAHQEQYLAELDPVNHYAALALTASQQDIALAQYAPCQADYDSKMTMAASQSGYLPRQEDPTTMDGLYPYYYHPVQDFNFAAAVSQQQQQQQQQPVYSHHTDYLNLNTNRTARTVAQSYPEITPSPPPQPPLNFHGLPGYHDGDVGHPSVHLTLPSRDDIGSSCVGAAYLKPSSSSGVAAALLHHSHDHCYAHPRPEAAIASHHRYHQMLPSHPIAIGGYHHQVTQDNAIGGWSMLSQALGSGTSLSGSA